MIKFGQKLDLTREYFVTSDLHFFHNNILKFFPEQRPFKDMDDMVERMIEQWNSVIGEDDIVFHLGDFSFAGRERTREVIKRLNGTIIFILGNHDKTVRTRIVAEKYHYLEVSYAGQKIVMCHYPMRSWNQQGRGSIMLFGHSHGGMPEFGRSMDVGYDANNGTFLRLASVVEYLNDKEIEFERGDHH